jgi:chaperonin GroEL
MDTIKAKTAIKDVTVRGPKLKRLILETMKICSDFVGCTLGPGGMSVLIERQEEGLPPLTTKDGVTAFRSLGFNDASMQIAMESVRDASIRTAAEAGDGTTSTAILAEALIRNTMAFCDRNPKVSPQRVVRMLDECFKTTLKPAVLSYAKKMGLGDETRKDLRAVAKVSANGDTELADAILDCFDLCGNDGNVTLSEVTGPSGYEVEHLDGYPIGAGYEDCCGKFYQVFQNDPGRGMCSLRKPAVILYHGRVNDIYSFLNIFDKLGGQVGSCILVSTGFSETVLAHLATNFDHPTTTKIYPLAVPLTQMKSGQLDFLQDLSALTGGVIFDPLNNPVENAELEQLGSCDLFEASRFRSTLFGYKDELLVLERVDQLKQMLNSPGISELDATIIKERLGKVTGGIAKLKVVGSSAGELREKRDRAEDAICSVRAAISHGGLPGGGWTLIQLQKLLLKEDSILQEVLIPSLQEPLNRLYTNAGYQLEEVEGMLAPIRTSETPLVYDILEGKYVDAFDGGVLDSVPAVLEALKNSISIAARMGTCGGICAFHRDTAVDRQNARDTSEWMRSANINEADERP